MRTGLGFVPLVVLSFILAAPGRALEKRAARLTDDPDEWRSGGTSSNCLTDYYNICTGWVWIWSGWAPGDRIGVCFASCCPAPLGAAADSSFVYFQSGAPAGYGFTGTIDVFAADANCCPAGAPLASQPWLPQSGWNGIALGDALVPPQFAVAFTFGPTPGTPVALVTDHPAQGPTGPPACGLCYPMTRDSHSYYWGSAASPFCPGSPFFDGVCDAEFLWDAEMHCEAPVSLESASWGAIKGLYR